MKLQRVTANFTPGVNSPAFPFPSMMQNSIAESRGAASRGHSPISNRAAAQRENCRTRTAVFLFFLELPRRKHDK
jgi:hypothetical protein